MPIIDLRRLRRSVALNVLGLRLVAASVVNTDATKERSHSLPVDVTDVPNR
jgi:hypothetical protein